MNPKETKQLHVLQMSSESPPMENGLTYDEVAGGALSMQEVTAKAALLIKHLAMLLMRQKTPLLLRQLAPHQRHLGQQWSSHRLLGVALTVQRQICQSRAQQCSMR